MRASVEVKMECDNVEGRLLLMRERVRYEDGKWCCIAGVGGTNQA